MRVQLRRNSDGLFQPDSEADLDALQSVHVGGVIAGDFKQPRNPGHHRKAFAMLHKLFANQDTFDDFEKFREWMQIAAGIVDTIIGPDGKVYYKVRSIAWDRMDQSEFEWTYQRFIDVAYEKLGHEWVLAEFA